MKAAQVTATKSHALADREPRWQLELGATVLGKGATRFRVWAPKAKQLSVRLVSGQGSEEVPLREEEHGYFAGTISGVGEGTLYRYLFQDGTERPDPASRFQPEGVHGPSQVVTPAAFTWCDQGWRGLALDSYLIYELHVGTYTREGTFEALIPHLYYLLRRLFENAPYLSLGADGERADQVCAFARVSGERSVLVVVPRFSTRLVGNRDELPLGIELWQGTRVVIPIENEGVRYRNVFTGETLEPKRQKGGGVLLLGDLLADFPVALLEGGGVGAATG
jgi:hypothetical protein